MRTTSYILLLSIVTLFAAPAFGLEKGDWQVRVGSHYVDPKSDNNDIVEVDGAPMLTFDVTYMVSDHWAVELLAALPFTHDINFVDGVKVGETDHLPPTLSVQYQFMPHSKIRPYVGLGVNWTIFFQEDLSGPLQGAKLTLDDSVGLAAQVGVDIDLTDRWFVGAVGRYIDISSDAKVNGASIGEVNIDPWAYGVHVGYRF